MPAQTAKQSSFSAKDLPGEEDVRKSAENYLIGKATKDSEFRRQLLSNPKLVIAKELGLQLPDDFEVKILEEGSKSFYMVLPASRVGDSDELSDQLLEQVAAGKDSTSGGTSTVPVTGGSQSGDTKHTVTLTTSGDVVSDP